jgi:hypothetical protein
LKTIRAILRSLGRSVGKWLGIEEVLWNSRLAQDITTRLLVEQRVVLDRIKALLDTPVVPERPETPLVHEPVATTRKPWMRYKAELERADLARAMEKEKDERKSTFTK